MKTTTATASEQESLSYYSTSSFTASSFEVLNYMELDLESILVKEFAQGLQNDLDNAGV